MVAWVFSGVCYEVARVLLGVAKTFEEFLVQQATMWLLWVLGGCYEVARVLLGG